MLFDKLAGFVERQISDLEDLDHFFLPFPRTAIEDRATCTFLFDGADKQVGLSSPRNFIDVLSLGGSEDPEAFSRKTFEIDPETKVWAKQEGLCQIALGRIFSLHLPNGSLNYQASACVDRLVVVNARGEIQSDMKMEDLKFLPGAEESCRGTIGNVITAVEELLLINGNPEYLILEKAPVKNKKNKAGRITRSPDRPRYIPLKPDAIRKTMGLDRPAVDGTSGKRPHERRRHWRLLKSERFKNMQGQRIMVEACWVGPSEVVNGKTRYRVRLDI